MNALTTFDTDYFSSLNAEVRRDVTFWMEVCERIATAKSANAAIADEAHRLAHMPRCSQATIRRKFYAFKRNGWQGLINRCKTRKGGAELSIGEHFKAACAENQRSSKQAYRDMMREFRDGKYIEDVGTWVQVWNAENPRQKPPQVCPRNWTPKGWTYENLMRVCGLTAYERTASRIGRGAAMDFLPSVYSTRLGLRPGQIYQFDDMWHDARVNFGNNKVARRAIELACLDVASASRIAYGLKPRREDIESGKLKNLTEVDMRMLLAHVLINIGYHPDGCTLVVEHGTAAVGSDFELDLGRLSGGAVKIQRSGIINEQIHKGLFLGAARGNFKLKAALESQHALMHSAVASLPGQMGMNRDNSPEQQHGMAQYNSQLIKAAAALPPERAKLLRYPFLDFNKYAAVIAELYDILDWRTEHNLEGWDSNKVEEFRVSTSLDVWMPMDKLFELPDPERLAINALIDSDPYEYARPRDLSPREVWNNGLDALVRLPKSSMPMILGERLGTIRKVQDDGLICFQNAEYGPGEFRYLARNIQTPDGFRINLLPGTDYLIHINPFNLDECFISDLQGAFLGLAMRWQTVAKNDVDALNRQVGKVAKIDSQLRTPLARRGQGIIKDKIEMHKHNAKVFAGAPVTDAELDAHNRIQKTKGNLEDVFFAPVELPDEFEEETEGISSIY